MTRHDRHILQVALTTFLAHGTIMRMVFHQPLDHGGAKCFCGFRLYGNAHAVDSGCHTGHGEAAPRVVGIGVLNDRTLSTCPHGSERRMPAEVRQLETLRKARVQQVLTLVDFIGHLVYDNSGHSS